MGNTVMTTTLDLHDGVHLEMFYYTLKPARKYSNDLNE